jgi:hypothetical protein
MIEEANPFDIAISAAAIFATVFQECGAEGLRTLLDQLLEGVADLDELIFPSREALQRDTEELILIGLPQVASIVAEAAEQAPPDRLINCPYAPEDRCNYQSWQTSYQRWHRPQLVSG